MSTRRENLAALVQRAHSDGQWSARAQIAEVSLQTTDADIASVVLKGVAHHDDEVERMQALVRNANESLRHAIVGARLMREAAGVVGVAVSPEPLSWMPSTALCADITQRVADAMSWTAANQKLQNIDDLALHTGSTFAEVKAALAVLAVEAVVPTCGRARMALGRWYFGEKDRTTPRWVRRAAGLDGEDDVLERVATVLEAREWKPGAMPECAASIVGITVASLARACAALVARENHAGARELLSRMQATTEARPT